MKDGEGVTLGEFKNKYQDVTHENTQLKEKLQNTETTAGQSQQQTQEMVALMGNLDQINRVEEGTDWDELEELDPTEAVLKRDKIRRARDEVSVAMGELQQKEQQAYNAFVDQQIGKMVEMIPAWKDESAKTKDQGSIKENMRSYGYDDSEIVTLIDPRMMSMMNDFAKLKAKNTEALKAVKTVRKAPKVLGTNRNVQKGNPKDKLDKLVSKAKSSGDKRDAHEAIKALLASG